MQPFRGRPRKASFTPAPEPTTPEPASPVMRLRSRLIGPPHRLIR
jgi:hypothetical protein